MTNNLVWIKNTLTTKIHKEFPDKYILITTHTRNDDFDINDIAVNDVMLYKHTPKTYIVLGKVISANHNKIAIQKTMPGLGNHSASKIKELLSKQEYS